MAWFTVQLITSGTWYGTSQRIVMLVQSVWPVVVAAAVLTHRPGARAAEAVNASKIEASPWQQEHRQVVKILVRAGATSV